MRIILCATVMRIEHVSTNNITLTFPDGNTRDYAKGITAMDVARSLSKSLSKKVLAANQIIRHIRRGHVLSVTHIHGSSAEAVELLVDPNTPITRKKLSEFSELKKQIMIGAYRRSGEWHIARGDTHLMSGDRVVCICKPEELKSLERLFLK